MVLNIRSRYNVSFLSVDLSGQPILNDIVRATIKYSNSLYFDGFTYSSEPTTLILKNMQNGVYLLDIAFKRQGLHSVKIWSSANLSLSQESEVNVISDDEVVKRKVLSGEISRFEIKSDKESAITIQNLDTGLFYKHPGEFINSPFLNSMTPNGDSFYFETILPDGTYEAIANSGTKTVNYTVVVSESPPNNLIEITQNDILTPSGETSVIVDSKFSPMSGVNVKAMDKVTMVTAGNAVTDSKGNWSMLIEPGEYLFKFYKEGYNSVIFEGMV